MDSGIKTRTNDYDGAISEEIKKQKINVGEANLLQNLQVPCLT